MVQAINSDLQVAFEATKDGLFLGPLIFLLWRHCGYRGNLGWGLFIATDRLTSDYQSLMVKGTTMQSLDLLYGRQAAGKGSEELRAHPIRRH